MKIIATFFRFAASTPGQAILMWLFNLIWRIAKPATKAAIARGEMQKHIQLVLAEYELVIADAQIKGADGWTEEEKEEIRRRKTELEERLMNEN